MQMIRYGFNAGDLDIGKTKKEDPDPACVGITCKKEMEYAVLGQQT